jgi:hypothetical protein
MTPIDRGIIIRSTENNEVRKKGGREGRKVVDKVGNNQQVAIRWKTDARLDE